MHRGRGNWRPEGEHDLTRWVNAHAPVNWVENELLAGTPLAP